MIDFATLEKFDSQGMYKIYDRWPEIARQSNESNPDGIDYHGINHLVFAGMGGSGAIGDIFSSILSKTNLHVSIVKGFHLPRTVDSNTLVITTSISGNTLETLTVLDAANKTNCKIISFSSGGKIFEYCSKHKIEHRTIAQIHSPRASFPAFLFSMLRSLESIIPVKENDIMESISQLENLKKQISSTNLTDTNPSLSLAEWITEIPQIYYPLGLQAAAIRFRNSLAENAKIHAIMEEVLEACHNGIVSWEQPPSVKPILVEGQDDHIKTKEIWLILKKYFNENKIEYKEVLSIQGNILSKLITLIYLLDYCSIYRAILSKIDPSPTKSIDYIKKMQSDNMQELFQ